MNYLDLSDLIKKYVTINYQKIIYGHNVYNLLKTEKNKELSMQQLAEYWGKLMEERVIQALEEGLGINIIPCSTLTSKEDHFIKSTPDGVIIKGWKRDILIEIECPIYVSSMNKIKSSKYLQMQTHMYCGDKKKCFFVQYYPSHYHFYIIKRNEEFFKKIIESIKKGIKVADYEIEDQCRIDSKIVGSIGMNEYKIYYYQDTPWTEWKIDKTKLLFNF